MRDDRIVLAAECDGSGLLRYADPSGIYGYARFHPGTRYHDWLTRGSHAGKPLNLITERWYRDATPEEFGYYRAVVLPWIVEESAGLRKQDGRAWQLEIDRTHEGLMAAYSMRVLKRISVLRTSDMDAVQMYDYLIWCRSFAWDFFKLRIPEPEKKIDPQALLEEEKAHGTKNV